MKILVMGGSGFVGHAIVRALLKEGHSLSVLNRGRRPVPGTHQLIADRNVPAELAGALDTQSFDAIVDTNCYTGRQARDIIATVAERVPRALVISSAAVYADAAAYPPREAEPTGGGSAWASYGQDKTDVEHGYLDGAFSSVVAFRPPYICGPNNDLDRETWFFRRILAQRPVLVPGAGSVEYQFIHEDDLGAAVALWLRNPPPGQAVYNLADPQRVTSADLARLLADAAGRMVDVRLVGTASGSAKARDWFPFRDVHCAVDPTAFAERFGWAPTFDLTERFSQIFRELTDADRLIGDDWTPLEAEILARLRAGFKRS